MVNTEFAIENLKQVNVNISKCVTCTEGVAFELTETSVDGNHWCYWLTKAFTNGGECTFVIRNKNAVGLRIRFASEGWSDNAWLYFAQWSLSQIPTYTTDITLIDPDIVHVRVQIPAIKDESLCIGFMLLKDTSITEYLGFGQSVKIESFRFRKYPYKSAPSKSRFRAAAVETSHSRNSDLGRKAFELCKGKGLEIGALHQAFDLDAEVIYLDRDRTEDLRIQYKNDPRVNDIQQVQIVWHSSTYPFLDNNAFDFVINSHVLEHVTNPGRQIEEWMRIIRPGGILYMIVPDKNYCFDRRRAITSTEHLIKEFESNIETTTIEHYRDFIVNTQGEDGITRTISDDFIYSCYEQQSSIHVHTFTAESLKEFLIELKSHIPFNIIHYYSRGLHIHCGLQKLDWEV
jgi:SAM-dependent methyltransferase